jgi:hypothetical protein
MGLESANYKFVVKNTKRDDLVNFLMKLGVLSKKKINGGFLCFKLINKEYFIDFQILPENKKSYLILSIRIALCNSESVIFSLIDILNRLINKFHGTVFDENSKKTFPIIGDNENNQIKDAFIKKKNEFHKLFGNFTAAISGEEVFEYMRNLKK